MSTILVGFLALDLRPARSGRPGCADAVACAHGAGMETIGCDTCGAVAVQFVRGWRAYLGLQLVCIACPECAERYYGEDEAPLADGSRFE
jgi:hypothetical protein